MLLISQPGTSQERTLQKQYPEGQAEHLSVLIHIDTLTLRYWQPEETLNCSCKETPDWKRPPDKCITLHINYILTTQGWMVWKGDIATHLEERSLVKKDALWARSSISFKSSSSIMSSGRASSSSFSSHFLAVADVYRLRSHMYSHPCKSNPAYIFETILLLPGAHWPLCMWVLLSQKTVPLLWHPKLTSANTFLPSLNDSSRCQNGYILYLSQFSHSFNRNSNYLYTENEVLFPQILQQEAAGYSVTPIPEKTLTNLFFLAFLQRKRLSRNSISDSLP